MKTKYYIIDGYNFKFTSLFDVRCHFEMYNNADKKSMQGALITGYNSKHEVTTCYIFVNDNGKVKLIRNK